MTTVVTSPSITTALRKVCFTTRTLNIIQPDITAASSVPVVDVATDASDRTHLMFYADFHIREYRKIARMRIATYSVSPFVSAIFAYNAFHLAFLVVLLPPGIM